MLATEAGKLPSLISHSHLKGYSMVGNPNLELQLREDPKTGVYAEGLRAFEITSSDQCLEILEKG